MPTIPNPAFEAVLDKAARLHGLKDYEDALRFMEELFNVAHTKQANEAIYPLIATLNEVCVKYGYATYRAYLVTQERARRTGGAA